MTTDKLSDEAETIYKLALARKIDFDLAVYMAMRLEQRSKIGADYLRYLCTTKPHFKRAFILRHIVVKQLFVIK